MEKLKVILISSLAVALLTVIFIKTKDTYKLSDSLKFKEEYESLNEVKKGENNYIKVEISDNNPMIYVTYEELIDIVKNDTAVIYFGFPKCPWCRNAVPVLIDAAQEVGLDKIYYFNALEIRDVKSLDENGNIIIEKEGTKEYNELIEVLYDYLDEYEGLNDPSIKRLYFPTIIFVRDGRIIGSHVGTIESQLDANNPLSDEQYQELKDIYVNYMLETMGTICDSDVEDKC